ncbi:MAG: KamA family radical SAM protein [Leptospirales bacterium]|nr:KamA family radical SAM protein [Leptospirales bacterium]
MRRQARSFADLLRMRPELAHFFSAEQALLQSQLETELADRFRFAATPHYVSLIDAGDRNCPILRQLLPAADELNDPWNRDEDPLAEESHMVAPGLVRRYPDRALWYVTHRCAVYCRFCFRKRKVSRAESAPSSADIDAALRYIRRQDSLREVILSGGDPLSLSDPRLEAILRSLREAPHLASIRIHTRMPVTAPMRITAALCAALAESYPITLVTHFNHAREAGPAAAIAVRRLREAGVVVLNQSVLLSGINDTVEAQRELLLQLLRIGVTPYYLHRCDEVRGVSHFRAPLERGLEILRKLRGSLPGIAIPRYIVDLPGGGGKVELTPDMLESGPSDGADGRRQFVFRSHAGTQHIVLD